MTFSYQDINEAMAKGELSYSKELITEIKKVNTYLTTGVGEEPEWLLAFLNSNKEKMLETVYRATMDKGITTLLGYNEGYFCEIVQNANDLHCGSDIAINVSKKDGIYELKCKYEDTGFEVSNIYAFLNREMSDKILKEDQTGKLGIGIKSFFKFVNELSITSNVNIRFTIDRDSEKGTFVKGNVARNKHWNNNNTVLMFKYDAKQKTGFNTDKLSKLVDYLCDEDASEQLEQMFYYGETKDLIFDMRSLMFMGMREEKQSISKIDFKGSKRKVTIKCDYDDSENIEYNGTSWIVKSAHLSIMVDRKEAYSYEFLMFQNGDFAFAYPLADNLEKHNRYYATYFLKEDTNDSVFPVSALIHSKYSNMYRNDLGESSQMIEQAYEDIKKNLLSLYEFMCSKEIGNSIFKVSVSDIFHSLLYRYMNVSKENFIESPLNVASVTTMYLPKTSKVSELGGNIKSYVVRHREVEAYETSAYAEGDISNELTRIYMDYIEDNEVCDYDSLVNNHQCIAGVKRLYKAVCEENICDDENKVVILDIMNLFLNVNNYIVYKITKVKPLGTKASDAQIDRWLKKCRDRMGSEYKENMLLKLIGRYEISDAVTYNGNVIGRNLSFKDYIFSGERTNDDGIMVKLQSKEFDSKYRVLKKELLEKRIIDEKSDDIYSVRCIQPELRVEEGKEIVFKAYPELVRQSVNRKELTKPILLLERFARDEELLDYISIMNHGYHMYLYQKKVGRFVYSSNDDFEHSYEFCQQIIDIGCMRNIKFDNYTEFIQALVYRNMIKNKEFRECIKLVYVGNKLTTTDVIEEFLPQMIRTDNEGNVTVLEGYDFENVKINNIIENTPNEYVMEYRNFVKRLTGYDIHIYRYDSKSNEKVLAFCCGNKFKVRIADDENFIDIARYIGKKKELFLFYDNYKKEVYETVIIVLKQLGIRNKTLQLMKGYICNKNMAKELDYSAYMRNIVEPKRKLIVDWLDTMDLQMDHIYDNEVLYRILTARGSYDIFCPICSDVMVESMESDDETLDESRHIIILENENNETKSEFPYIVTVCCTSCYERLKATLAGSTFDGKTLTISTQIVHGQYEKLIHKRNIELSPVNIEVMKHLKMINL